MSRRLVSLGFALTQHCNLRCPHCIRDDVTSVAELDVALILRILDEAREHLGTIDANFTGGEPMLHREWARLIEGLRERAIAYNFVTNGWHTRRFVPLLDRYAPASVRLSLSGATAEVHDEERGRDSFRRVLMSTAILTSRRVPVSYAFIIDRRTRGQLREALDLGTSMGVASVRYILPMPVPATAERNSDLPPEEWWTVRRELAAMAAAPPGRTAVAVDFGAPFLGDPFTCATMGFQRISIDVHGRIATCCMLSDYGGTTTEIVADLTTQPFAEGWAEYQRRIGALAQASAPRGTDDPLEAFPCLRCARSSGKLEFLRNFPDSPWAPGVTSAAPTLPFVPISYSRRARRTVALRS